METTKVRALVMKHRDGLRLSVSDDERALAAPMSDEPMSREQVIAEIVSMAREIGTVQCVASRPTVKSADTLQMLTRLNEWTARLWVVSASLRAAPPADLVELVQEWQEAQTCLPTMGPIAGVQRQHDALNALRAWTPSPPSVKKGGV
jgi:hypothetical protein